MKRRVFVILRKDDIFVLVKTADGLPALPSFDLKDGEFEFSRMHSWMRTIFPEFECKSVKATLIGSLDGENGERVVAHIFVVREASGWLGHATNCTMEAGVSGLNTFLPALPSLDKQVIAFLKEVQARRMEEARLL